MLEFIGGVFAGGLACLFIAGATKTNKENEIYMQDDSIILKKHKPACVFCGESENCIEFENQKICKNCVYLL